MKPHNLLDFFASKEPRLGIVRGRLRAWQWTLLWIVIGVLLLLLPRALLRIAFPIVAPEFCVVGAFGVSIGWWKTILVLAIPIPVLIGVGIYAITFFSKVKNLPSYPPTGDKPLVDTRLRQGNAVRRYATQNLISGIAAMLMAAMAIYFLADMTAEYGLADASNFAQSCRR
jgi:hypothetical protein